MRRILLLVTVLGVATPARAQDQAAHEEPDFFSRVDKGFAEWVVVPMFKVLFFDVVFWDNSEEAFLSRCAAAGLTDDQCDTIAATEASATDVVGAYCRGSGRSSTECAAITAAVTAAGDESEARISACATAGLDRATCEAALGTGDAATAYCVGALAGPSGNVGDATGTCKDLQKGVSFPFIVLWLVLGAVFFTFRFLFISIRAFPHAIAVTRGNYDHPDHPGEVSHFQALSSALSATVGLGNIAGVAVAVGTGGPGAVLWMVIAGFFGMSSKFAECTLGQLYREVDPRGNVSGGPMRYLQKGLAEIRLKPLGKVLSILFAFMCMGGSLGGGNMFQANQSYAQMAKVFPPLDSGVGSLIYGVLLAILVGVVIIGGIKRIGNVAGYIVPFMCGIYVLAGLVVVFTNIAHVGPAFAHIFAQAFTPEAGLGGALGVLVTGFQRAAFSNEAGIGSASIAHSAAATDEPVREGIVALLEPFIDTIVVCSMTGIVIVISGAYESPGDGVVMTSNAFASVISWFPYVLSIAVFFFAFSTMISWSYYGERCWSFLFGPGSAMVYRVVFLLCVVLGSILKLGSVIDFSDLMVLGMAFPNILGVVLLSNKVSKALNDYWSRYRSGEMVPTRGPKARAKEPAGEADGG